MTHHNTEHQLALESIVGCFGSHHCHHRRRVTASVLVLRWRLRELTIISTLLLTELMSYLCTNDVEAVVGCVCIAHVYTLCTYNSCTCPVYIQLMYVPCVHTAHVRALCTYSSCTCPVYVQLMYMPCVRTAHVRALCTYSSCTCPVYIQLMYSSICFDSLFSTCGSEWHEGNPPCLRLINPYSLHYHFISMADIRSSNETLSVPPTNICHNIFNACD